MELIDQVRALDALSQGIESPVPIYLVAVWAQVPVWPLWKREKRVSLPLPGIESWFIVYRAYIGVAVLSEVMVLERIMCVGSAQNA
jgi:hypothetical protein